MKIGVLDVTHAGAVLAEHYALSGHDVTAIDTYHTTKKAPENCKLTREPQGNYDLLVTPVHLPERYLKNIQANRIISHHEAVGELLKEQSISAKIIEITGTRSKTTTALTLNHLLQDKYNVVVNTSAGLLYNNEKIAHLSIAPGNVLKAIELTAHLNPDIYIFEISLGGTTQADFGVLTTLDEDYLIAESTKWASDAKIHTLFGKHTQPIIQHNTPTKTHTTLPPVTFGDNNSNVYIDKNMLCYTLKEQSGTLQLPVLFDPEAYKTGIEASVATALHLLMPEEIQESLNTYTGVLNRMRLEKVKGRIFINNSNSGIRAEELDTLLEKASSYGKIFLIHGEDGKVCEGLDCELSKKVIQKWQHKLIGAAIIGFDIDNDNTYRAKTIEEATQIAFKHTSTDDVILSCVKCFR